MPSRSLKRSPAAAFWLSLLPGVGHFYLGQYKTGLTFALLAAGLIQLTAETGEGFFGLLIPVAWLFAMFDAHRSAQAINLGVESGGQVNLFAGSGSKWWGGILIGLGVLFLLVNLDLVDLDWLWRFWPVVLIVIGFRLIMPGPAKPVPTPPPTPPPLETSSPSIEEASVPEQGQEEGPQETSSADEGEEDERADAV